MPWTRRGWNMFLLLVTTHQFLFCLLSLAICPSQRCDEVVSSTSFCGSGSAHWYRPLHNTRCNFQSSSNRLDWPHPSHLLVYTQWYLQFLPSPSHMVCNDRFGVWQFQPPSPLSWPNSEQSACYEPTPHLRPYHSWLSICKALRRMSEFSWRNHSPQTLWKLHHWMSAVSATKAQTRTGPQPANANRSQVLLQAIHSNCSVLPTQRHLVS